MAMSPFEADLRWQPAFPLDLLSQCSNTTIQSAVGLKVCPAYSLDDFNFALRIAQARQSAFNQKRYTPPNYTVGDHVFLSRKLFTTAVSEAQPSEKIGVKRYKPCKISELIGDNAVRGQLSNNSHIHPAIHIEHTGRVHRQPAVISNRPPPQAQQFIDASSELVVEVERILAHRRRENGSQSLTLFKRTPNREAVWEPLRAFVDADRTITAVYTPIYSTTTSSHISNEPNIPRPAWLK